MSVIVTKMSKFFFPAYARTVGCSPYFLQGLQSMRDGYIEDFNAKEISLKAKNGDTINGLHFPGNTNKALIFLHGNGCFYETSAVKPLRWIEGIEISQRPHLVIFNPRGTGKSEGHMEPDLVSEDFQCVFDYLNKCCGGALSHTIFSGHSMGAFLGSKGAACVQKLHPEAKIHFLSDRSLRDLKDRIPRRTDSSLYA